MGVTRDSRDLFIYGYFEDETEILDESSEDEVLSPNQVPLCRKNTNKNKRKSKPCDLLEHINRRKIGARQARRTDNLNHLLNLAEKDVFGELDVDDKIFEPTVSAFAALLADDEKMKIWNNFVNKSEQEQERILHPVHQSRKRSQKKRQPDCCDNDVLDDTWEEIPDKRAAHPAFTAEDCYRKIHRDLKDVLRKRNIQMDMLERLEDDIVTFFKEWPNSVYVSNIAPRFERMLLHALCQFLDLQSQSYEEEGGRRTQVENKYSTFLPPSPLLSQYLQQQYSFHTR